METILFMIKYLYAAKPKPVPGLEPESDEEKILFDGALRRRQLRLILGGKMKPHDAAELKALFKVEWSLLIDFFLYNNKVLNLNLHGQ